jgi:hypothetical protein
MTDYEILAEEIRAKRQYREAEDGTVFCNLSRCPGSEGLRCYRTGVPICQQCSVRTPVGYLSKEAAREQQDQFFYAQTIDYALAGVVAFFANLVIGFFATLIGELGFWGYILLGVLLAPAAAGMISEVIWRVSRKKRGRYTGQVAAVGIILSSLLLIPVAPDWLALLIYAAVVVTTLNARFQLNIRF